MKRHGMLLSLCLVASMICGCDGGGIQEGTSTAPPAEGGAPPGFRELMQKDEKNMQLKGGRPKTAAPAKKAG